LLGECDCRPTAVLILHKDRLWWFAKFHPLKRGSIARSAPKRVRLGVRFTSISRRRVAPILRLLWARSRQRQLPPPTYAIAAELTSSSLCRAGESSL